MICLGNAITLIFIESASEIATLTNKCLRKNRKIGNRETKKNKKNIFFKMEKIIFPHPASTWRNRPTGRGWRRGAPSTRRRRWGESEQQYREWWADWVSQFHLIKGLGCQVSPNYTNPCKWKMKIIEKQQKFDFEISTEFSNSKLASSSSKPSKLGLA